jgi:hypothetical protein
MKPSEHFALAFGFVVGCGNSGDPSGPPPAVQPPVIACTAAPVPAPADASTDAQAVDADKSGTDGAADAEAGIDAGPGLNDPDAEAPYQDSCAIPPSTCADNHWLAYFDDGRCVNGTCELIAKYHYCTVGCSEGSCQSNSGGSTAPSSNRF